MMRVTGTKRDYFLFKVPPVMAEHLYHMGVYVYVVSPGNIDKERQVCKPSEEWSVLFEDVIKIAKDYLSVEIEDCLNFYIEAYGVQPDAE